MIILGYDKTKQLYVDGERIYKVYHGLDLIYNCYVIPSDTEIWLRADGTVVDVFSNSEWIINK